MRLSRAEAREVNRRTLLNAAATLVTRDGAGVRVEDVAEAAGVTTGAIYSIFGSKSKLLAAVLTDEMSHVELVAGLARDPGLSLRDVIERYVKAWFELHGDESIAHTSFELQVLMSALKDSTLLEQLTTALNDDLEQLASVLTDRVVDPNDPARRTNADEAATIARALRAMLSGFGLHQLVFEDTRAFALRCAGSLVALVDALETSAS